MGKLNWNTISPSDFEDICLYIAECYITKEIRSESTNANYLYTFSRHLKNGHKQDGIDIISNIESGKYICIQCKNTQQQNKTTLKEIIDKFKEGCFLRKTEKFIIITSADLQKIPTKEYILDISHEFNSLYNINLEFWDCTDIENKLKNCYSLVLKYFGKGVAEDLCYFDFRDEPIKNTAIENYINREITQYQKDKIAYNNKVQNTSLEKLFINNLIETKKICITSDAYQGKTTLLKNLTYVLSNNNTSLYYPIFISIRNIRPISLEQKLDENYSYWRRYPAKEVVVILDGLDEVKKDELDSYISVINDFKNKYISVNIVISCRTIFISNFFLEEPLKDFQRYNLLPLNENDIKIHIDGRIKYNADSFNKYINDNSLDWFLTEPFYLDRLISLYSDKKIGKNHINKPTILNLLIEESFNQSSRQRKLSNGDPLKNRELEYKKCIKKIALNMQIYDETSLSNERFQRIITIPENTELILNSSILTQNDNNQTWTFTNIFFQESFAALALKDLPIEQIEELITVGKSKKKIKQNWLQTAFTLISILDEPTKTSKLIELIEQDNIELLALCETSIFDYDFRLDAFKKIIKQCIKKERFPIICDTRSLALLIRDKKNGLDYILSELENDHPQFIKNLLWQIIYYHDSVYKKEDVIIGLTNTHLESSNDVNCISVLLDIQTKFGLLNKNTVAKLLNNDSLISNYWILTNILKAITNKGWVDEFYRTAINRIELYENKPKTSTVYAPEHRFEDFLLQTNNTDNIDILLKFVSRNIHKIIHRYTNKGNDVKLFYEEIVKKALSAYKNKKRVIKPMISIVKELLNSIEVDHLQVLTHFFDITKKRYQLFRSCFSDQTKYWRYPVIMDAKCEDYIFSEYNNRKINNYPLDHIYRELYITNKKLAEYYCDRTKSITGYDIKIDNIEYWKKIKHDDETRKLNDIKAIQSQEDFSRALQLYYNARGNKWIENYDRNNDAQRQSDSNFINYFLGSIQVTINSLSLKDCEKYINDKNWFEDFRAKAIYDYNFPDEISKEKILPILEKYYYSEVEKASFENAIIQSSSVFNISYKEKLLADIYTKFLFPTDDKILVKFLWLVHNSFNHLKPNRYFSRISNEHTGLNKNILKNVKDIDLLKHALITNLKNGIDSELVRNSHLEYCRELKITEATDIIIQLINERKFQDHNYKDAIDIFLELGGNTYELLELLNNVTDYNSELFIVLIEKLIEIEPYEVGDNLKIALNNVESKEKQNEIGLFLIKLGEEIGLETVINNLINCELYEHIDYKIRVPDLSKIDTRIALKNLDKIKSHILDNDYYRNRSHISSKKNFLLDCLYNLSKKSEYGLELVESFLLTTIEDLKKTHENANVIYYHIDRMIESFRKTTSVVEESKLFKILDNIKL